MYMLTGMFNSGYYRAHFGENLAFYSVVGLLR